MKTLKIILITLASLFFIILLCGWYIGFFKNIEPTEKQEGGYTAAGMEFTGPYSKAGKYIMDVDNKLKAMGIACEKGFGIYYDDPKAVPAEKCRSFVGNILEEKDFNRIPELKSAGFRIDSIPRAKAVIAEFPIKNTLSYMFGPMKVYPALSKYMSEKGYKCALSLEVYDTPNKKIIFIMQY